MRDKSLAKLSKYIVNQVLLARATEHLRARPYECTEEEEGCRNGYRRKDSHSEICKKLGPQSEELE